MEIDNISKSAVLNTFLILKGIYKNFLYTFFKKKVIIEERKQERTFFS